MGRDSEPGKSGITRRWSAPSVSLGERRHFFDEVVTPGNLKRMFWLIVACLPISIAFFIENLLALREEAMNPWLIFDIGLAGGFLWLNKVAQRKGAAFRHGHKLVLVYYAYTLASMTGYYFSAFPRFGENAVYALGPIMAAILFRLPPRQFLSLLLINHTVFTTLVFTSGRSMESTMAALICGLDAVVISCLAAWFLFAKEWDDFQKERVIAERNRELALANAILKRNQEEMNEIMAIAAHDLRSPLQGMKAWLDLLGPQDEWKREPYAGVVSGCGRACGDMLSLVGRLLDAHTAETRETELELRRIDVRCVVEGTIGRNHIPAEQRNVRLEAILPAERIEITTDPEALEQAMDNLLSNALKFSPSGSSIEVAVLQSGETCLIEIRDSGPGLAEQDVARLFRKFHRGRNRPPGKEAGTGLGLFIVRQLMEKLGGSVAYQPRVPQGAIFRLELPLSAEFAS